MAGNPGKSDEARSPRHLPSRAPIGPNPNCGSSNSQSLPSPSLAISCHSNQRSRIHISTRSPKENSIACSELSRYPHPTLTMASSRLSSRSLSVLCRATTTTMPASATVSRRFAGALRFSSSAAAARPVSRPAHGCLVHARFAASRKFTTTAVLHESAAGASSAGSVPESRQWSFEEMVELAKGAGKDTVVIGPFPLHSSHTRPPFSN